jgi:hypothetical protein
MYTLNMPVSTIRTKMRQEFERHRYVTKLKTVDVLIYNSHAEFQVRILRRLHIHTSREKEVLTHDTFYRRLSTSGSSSHTCSSTSAPKRTPRRHYRRLSLPVSSRYVNTLCYLTAGALPGQLLAPYAMLTDLPFLQGRN